MNEIINEISDVLNTLDNEKEALKKQPSTNSLTDKFASSYESEINNFTDKYMVSKHHELTVDTYEFNSAWSMMSYEERKEVITLLESKNQNALANELKQKLVIFEDLTDESDELLLKLTEATHWNILARSLKLTGDWSDNDCKEIQQRILSIVPVPRASEIKDDIEFMGPIPLSDVLSARKELCNKVIEIYKL